MKIGGMCDSARDNLCFTDPEGAIRDFLAVDRKWCLVKARQGTEDLSKQCPSARWADNRQRRPLSTLVFREDNFIEQVRDEVREVICVVMRKQDMSHAMTIDACPYQIHECARPEIKLEEVVGLHEIAGSRPFGMNVCSRAENCQAHGVNRPSEN